MSLGYGHRSPSNLTLADLCQDRQRVEWLLRHELGKVRRYFRGRVDPGEVDDLVQRTITGLLAGAHRFAAEASLGAVLAGIARRQLGKFVRDRSRSTGRHDPQREVAELESMHGSPCDSYLVAESCARVRAILPMLTREHQEVLELRYWGEHSPGEIAEKLGVSVITVRTRLFRARAALRRAMMNCGDDRGDDGNANESVGT